MGHDNHLGIDGWVADLVREAPDLAPLTAKILWHCNHSDDTDALLASVLPDIAKAIGGDYLAVAVAKGGRWTILSDSGRPRSLPVDLLAEVLDRDEARRQNNWLAAPLDMRSAVPRLLVAYCGAGRLSDESLAVIQRLVPLCCDALAAVANRHRHDEEQTRRIGRLQAILEITQRWNQNQQMESLLEEMARAATRLLGADRASIFLWDRPNRTLIGRPALGVEDDELRIPDNKGVVGKVVQTGLPLRVDADNTNDDSDQIDRQVDEKLGYQTKTLLCVPLRGSSGELFGAFEILNKHSGSFTAEDEAALVELASHAAVALQNTQDREKLFSVNRQISEQAAQGAQLIGQSPAIQTLRSITQRVAETDLAVLILGENGTGKEVVAKLIHYLSRRRDKPFIAVNCAAIPDTLAESELFGHEKGAFTDAIESRPGKFELAADGTLLLDEIGDLSLGGQANLLRVLEEKVLVRVGGSVPIHTDVRVVAATNQNLAEMVRQKRFREDLYFRLNVVTIELPPLCGRTEDIMLLAEYFLKDFCMKARRQVPKFSAAARRRLETHPWPGNVRELRNLMERLAYLSTENRIEAEQLAFILSPGNHKPLVADVNRPLSEATAQFQEEYIKQTVEQVGGNISQAAARLGLHRSNLYRKMRQLGMPIPV